MINLINRWCPHTDQAHPLWPEKHPTTTTKQELSYVSRHAYDVCRCVQKQWASGTWEGAVSLSSHSSLLCLSSVKPLLLLPCNIFLLYGSGYKHVFICVWVSACAYLCICMPICISVHIYICHHFGNYEFSNIFCRQQWRRVTKVTVPDTRLAHVSGEGWDSKCFRFSRPLISYCNHPRLAL